MTTKPQSSRRRFLKKALLVTAAIPMAGLGAFLIKQKKPQVFIADVLKKKLSYLQVSEQTIQTFTQAYMQHYLGDKPGATGLVMLLISFADWLAKVPGLDEKLSELEETIARDFLLATDFFQHGAQVNREVNFIGIHSPFTRPCAHPFSNNYS